jgi:hypothetical protein
LNLVLQLRHRRYTRRHLFMDELRNIEITGLERLRNVAQMYVDLFVLVLLSAVWNMPRNSSLVSRCLKPRRSAEHVQAPAPDDAR